MPTPNRVQQAKTFAEACEAAADQYENIGKALAQNCQQAGCRGDVGFWQEAAQDARKAARIWRAILRAAREFAARRMEAEGLRPPFAEALISGEYGELLNVSETRSGAVEKLPRPQPLGRGARR